MVISDLKMPRMGGLELLKEVARAHPDTLTVIMTGFGTVETAIDAMKRGAYDYILKPFKVEEVVHIVQRGLEKQRLAAENLRLREALSLYKVSEAIAASLSLDEVMATVTDSALTEVRRRRRVAPGSTTARAASSSAACTRARSCRHGEDLGELDTEARRSNASGAAAPLVEHGARARGALRRASRAGTSRAWPSCRSRCASA